MLTIDGAYGEGGGQILRTSVALSTLKKESIKIINIRANRPDPGIKAQHYIAIKSVKELCNAETTGLDVGSSTLTFIPGDLKGGKYKFDIGTAGSIILVFQTCILASLKSKEPVTIKLTGGTDVKWAPTWDYFKNVFISLLKNLGLLVDINLIKRGYYPKGGGEAEITIYPVSDFKQLTPEKEQKFSEVHGVIHISNLPDHISTRIKHSAIKELLKYNLKEDIIIEKTNSFSPGTGIVLWVKSNDTVIGSTVLGEKNLTAEEVGKKVVKNLLAEIESGANFDVHAFDQILPYLVISNKNESPTYFIRELSSHARTNIWVLKHFFDVDFEIKQNEKNVSIKIKNK
ncbi:MAG: RNA 3'-terminal phosphate cyclase [Thermoplasmatota archaeon]